MREDFHCLFSCGIALRNIYVLEISVISSFLAGTWTPSHQHKIRTFIDDRAEVISASLQEGHKELSSNGYSEIGKMVKTVPSISLKPSLSTISKETAGCGSSSGQDFILLLQQDRQSAERAGWIAPTPQSRADIYGNSKNYGTRKSTSWKVVQAAAP